MGAWMGIRLITLQKNQPRPLWPSRRSVNTNLILLDIMFARPGIGRKLSQAARAAKKNDTKPVTRFDQRADQVSEIEILAVMLLNLLAADDITVYPSLFDHANCRHRCARWLRRK